MAERRETLRNRLASVARGLVLAVVILAPWLFGAADPAAYLALAIGVNVAALLWLLSVGSAPRLHFGMGPVLWLCVGIGVLVLFQAVPLPAAIVRLLNPQSAAIQCRRDETLAGAGLVAAPATVRAWMPLSLCAPASLRSLYRVMACAVAFVLVVHAFEGWQHLRRAAGLLVACGFVMAVFAIAQRLSGTQKMYWYQETAVHDAVTSFGPFLNRNHFAAHMNLLFGIAVGLLLAENTLVDWTKIRGWRARLRWLSTPEGGHMTLLAFAGAVMALSVCLSLSRAGVASLLAGLVWVAGLSRRRGIAPRYAVAAVAIVAALVAAGLVWLGWGAMGRRIGALAAGVADPLTHSRVAAYRDGWRMFLSSPWIGFGFGSFQHVFPRFQSERLLGWRWTHLHNDFLEILIEGGLVGFVLVVGIVVAAWRLIATWRDHMEPERAAFVHGLTVGAVAVALHSAVDFSLHRFANALLLATVTGLAVGAVTRPDETERMPYARPASWGRLEPQLLTGAAALVLSLLVVLMKADLDGEVAFARFSRWDALREQQSEAARAAYAAGELAREAEAVIHFGRNNPDHLIEVAVRLLHWLPNDAIGSSLRIQLSKQAERAALGAVRVAPSNYEYWLWLARIEALLGRENAAALCLRRARDLAPHGKALVLQPL